MGTRLHLSLNVGEPALQEFRHGGLIRLDKRASVQLGDNAGERLLRLSLALTVRQRVKLDFALAGSWVAHRQLRVPIALTAFANMALHCTAPSLARGLVLVHCLHCPNVFCQWR